MSTGLKVRKEDTTFEVAPAGSFPAVCVAVIDLGTHEEEIKDTGEKKWTRKLYLGFEISKRKADGGPWLVAKAYTLSLNDRANLTKVVDALYGPIPVGGELSVTEDLPGEQCGVVIKHKTGVSAQGQPRTYANLTDVTPPMDGQAPVLPQTPIITWSMGDPLTPEVVAAMAELPRVFGVKVADKIKQSREMVKKTCERDTEGAEDEDIPF